MFWLYNFRFLILEGKKYQITSDPNGPGAVGLQLFSSELLIFFIMNTYQFALKIYLSLNLTVAPLFENDDNLVRIVGLVRNGAAEPPCQRVSGRSGPPAGQALDPRASGPHRLSQPRQTSRHHQVPYLHYC